MNAQSEAEFSANDHSRLNLPVIDKYDEHDAGQYADESLGCNPYVMRTVRFNDQRKQVSPYQCAQLTSNENAVILNRGENDYDVPQPVTPTRIRRWTKCKSLETKQQELCSIATTSNREKNGNDNENEEDDVSTLSRQRRRKVNTLPRVDYVLQKETVPLMSTTTSINRRRNLDAGSNEPDLFQTHYENIDWSDDVASRQTSDTSLFDSNIWIRGKATPPVAHESRARGNCTGKRCCRIVSCAVSLFLATTICVLIVAFVGGSNNDEETDTTIAIAAAIATITIVATTTTLQPPMMVTEKFVWYTTTENDSSPVFTTYSARANDNTKHTTTATTGTSRPNVTFEKTAVNGVYDQQAINRCITDGVYINKWPLFLDLDPDTALNTGMLCTVIHKSANSISSVISRRTRRESRMPGFIHSRCEQVLRAGVRLTSDNNNDDESNSDAYVWSTNAEIFEIRRQMYGELSRLEYAICVFFNNTDILTIEPVTISSFSFHMTYSDFTRYCNQHTESRRKLCVALSHLLYVFNVMEKLRFEYFE